MIQIRSDQARTVEVAWRFQEDPEGTGVRGRRPITASYSIALYLHRSVQDNLGFSLKLRKVFPLEILKRVNEVAETFGGPAAEDCNWKGDRSKSLSLPF